MNHTSLDPKGYEFTDANGKQWKLVTEGTWKDWLVYKHPDGQWVSGRKATGKDWLNVARAMSLTIHPASSK